MDGRGLMDAAHAQAWENCLLLVVGEGSEFPGANDALPVVLTGLGDLMAGVSVESLTLAELDGRIKAQARGDTPILLFDENAVVQNLGGIPRAFMGRGCLDLQKLARILLPRERSYELHDLAANGGAAALNVIAGGLGLLWKRIVEKAMNLALPVLGEIPHVLAGRGFEGERAFFQWILSERGATAPRKRDFYGVYESVPAASPPVRRLGEAERALQPVDPAQLHALLGAGGAMSKAIPGYEPRAQQLDMAGAVATAFNESKHLMVEAGTGVGKSMAYLLPSVLWAQENAVPVIVSTNTKNLQSQLMEKDIPLVRQTLGEDFSAVLLKGRRNYLCLRKLLHLLEHGGLEMTTTHRVGLAAIMVWMLETASGDIAECRAVQGKEGESLWDHVTSESGECPASDPLFRDRCFVQRVRRQAQAADLVVANHAVVFSELDAADEGTVLPPYRYIVFDEAHNIEQAATTHLSVEISRTRWGYLAGSLWKSGRRKAGGGILALILSRLEKTSDAGAVELRKGVETVLTSLGSADMAAVGCFDELRNVAAAAGSGGTVRVPSAQIKPERWQALKDAERAFHVALLDVELRMESLAEQIKEGAGGPSGMRDLSLRVGHLVEQLREFRRNVEFVLGAADPNYVYWLETTQGRQLGRACAAPLLIGPLLHDLLFSKKQSVILASATLSVMGGMDFVKGRLGLADVEPERVLESNVGTPFDYTRQCRVLVPTFLPEPGRDETGYAAILGKLLSKTFEKTRGRALVLFTSYALMENTVASFRQEGPLAHRLLIQGESGSREALTDLFRKDTHSVLMGTQSFWEGVDVVGESLSCVVVTRLPFAVYTDPIQTARSEQIEAEGRGAFMQFSLPNAIIRFRQGFGRLIRHRNDRGIVIVTDSRAFSKPYGRWFRSSIGAPWQKCETEEEFLDAVEQAMA